MHQFVHDAHLVERGLRNYWGYNSIGFLAPHNEYAAGGQRGEQVAEFKAMVRALHEAGHRGDPRRRLQPHRRGQPPGPDPVDEGHRQRRLLPPGGRRPPLLLRHHRHRQQPQRGPPAHPAADHGLAALLGDRDARRRVPLRPGRQPGPPVPRGRPAVRVLRPDPAGPGGLARSSSSPSRGTSARAATRSATSRPCGRSGTASTATRCGTSGAASRPRWASSPPASPAAPTCTRPTPATRGPASTSSPPTTASRCATWSPTTRSTTRPTGRTTPTARATTAPGTAGPKGDTDDQDVLAAAAAAAAQLPRHAAALAGGPDAARRGRARAHPARQQQRLLPGQRDLLVRLGARRRGPARVHPPPDRAAARAPGAAPAPLVPGPAHPGLGRPRLVPAGRGRDERRRLGCLVRPRSACSSTARRSPTGTAAASG